MKPTNQNLAEKPQFVEGGSGSGGSGGEKILFFLRPPADRENFSDSPCYCVCLEPRPRKIENIMVLPLSRFLDSLWAGEYS